MASMKKQVFLLHWGSGQQHYLNFYPEIFAVSCQPKRRNCNLGNIQLQVFVSTRRNYNTQMLHQKILAAIALKSAGTPRRQCQLFFQKKLQVQDTIGDEKATMETFRDKISTLVLVATLIITITFVSGFVMGRSFVVPQVLMTIVNGYGVD